MTPNQASPHRGSPPSLVRTKISIQTQARLLGRSTAFISVSSFTTELMISSSKLRSLRIFVCRDSEEYMRATATLKEVEGDVKEKFAAAQKTSLERKAAVAARARPTKPAPLILMTRNASQRFPKNSSRAQTPSLRSRRAPTPSGSARPPSRPRSAPPSRSAVVSFDCVCVCGEGMWPRFARYSG